MDPILEEAAQVDGELGAGPAAQVIAAGEGGELELQAAPQAAPTIATAADHLAGLVTIIASIYTPLFPSLGQIYTPETIAKLAGATAPVFDKYGWSRHLVMDKWAAEIGCAVVVAPIAAATYQGVKRDLAARREAAAKELAAALSSSSPAAANDQGGPRLVVDNDKPASID